MKTPLITCCVKFGDHFNVECIKKLLLAGANKEARDVNGLRAVDFLEQMRRFDKQMDNSQVNEAIEILNETYTLAQCVGVKGSYSK